jgi:endonuclease/exonuclease/phosphatase family metal-dependent hydrolase
MVAALFTLPKNAMEPPPPETLRVLSYNIHHGQGTDGRLDLPRLARVIAEAQPDLVALQEVDQGAARTDGVDQAAVLGELTGMTPVYGAFMDLEGGSYGMALLTRWELVRTIYVPLPGACQACSCNPFPCPEGRSSVVLVVRSPQTGRQVVLAGVHLYQTEPERLAQAEALAAALQAEQAPVILAGDFNSRRGTAVMDGLSPSWQILDKIGPPDTFPAPAPDREIDFVLLRRDAVVEVIDHRVLEETLASDHRPILAELRLLGGGPP